MSLVTLSYIRNYWSSEFRVDQVADTMTLNRFEDIKSFLHFSDNSIEGSDKIKKIRPLVEKLRERYKTVPKEEHLSVDEQIVPIKGQSCLRQHNPRKPHKWVTKSGCCAGQVASPTILKYTPESRTILFLMVKKTAAPAGT